METFQIPEFKLTGLKLNKKTFNKGGQSGIDCGSLWQKFQAENVAERIPDKLGHEIYAVYFAYEGDHTNPFSYFIGCKVGANTQTPEGMDSLTIPEQKYTKVIAKGEIPDCIGNSWQEIWRSKIDRAYQYDFEIYDERSQDWSHAEVDIYLSIN